MLDKKEYFKQYYQINKLNLIKSISQWQKKNKKKVASYKTKCKHNRRNELRSILNEIKQNSNCECGESYHKCLEFHHLDKSLKIENVSKMINKCVSVDIFKNEIKKCKIMCSNCHRKLHFYKTPTNRALKFKIAYKTKTVVGCKFCNEKHYACLDFHHLHNKIDTIGNMTKQKKYNLSDITNEIKKCIVICTNCHRKLHDNILFI